MPTIHDARTGQAIHVCDGCGEIVGILVHPYALSKMLDQTADEKSTNPSATGAAFSACERGCGLTFVACLECGGQAHNDAQLQLHYQDSRAACWAPR